MTGRQNVYFALVRQISFNYSNPRLFFFSFAVKWQARNGCLTCCDGCFDGNSIDLLKLLWLQCCISFVCLMSSVWEMKGPIYTSHQSLPPHSVPFCFGSIFVTTRLSFCGCVIMTGWVLAYTHTHTCRFTHLAPQEAWAITISCVLSETASLGAAEISTLL